MNHVISISYRGQQPGASSPVGSLALAQELPEQKQLTVADVATIIDDMHGVVDPCLNARDNNSYFATPLPGTSLREHQQQYLQSKYSSTSSLENLASQFGGSCLVKQGRPIKLEIYAFWSNREIEDNYKLICPVGRVDNKRQVQSRFRLRIEVSNASAIDFSYFVLDRPGFPSFKHLEWISGNVVDQYGRAKTIASPRWDRSGRLYWSENIRSGHIFAEFDTIYDQWTCTLQGVWTEGKRDYNATVTAIWAGSPVELSLEVPDAGAEESDPCSSLSNTTAAVDLSVQGNEPAGSGDPEKKDCEQRIDYEIYGRCSGDLIDYYTEYVPAPCEDGKNPPDKIVISFAADPGYDCGSACTAEGYEEICCRPPAVPGCVPTCLEYYSTNQGGLLPPGGMDALKKEYGDDVQVIWVYPEDGDCGVHTDKLVLPNEDCCPDAYALVTYVDNKLTLSGAGVDWSWEDITGDDNYTPPPELQYIPLRCGSLTLKGYNHGRGTDWEHPWIFEVIIVVGGEVIYNSNEDPGATGVSSPDVGVYELVYSKTIEISG